MTAPVTNKTAVDLLSTQTRVATTSLENEGNAQQFASMLSNATTKAVSRTSANSTRPSDAAADDRVRATGTDRADSDQSDAQDKQVSDKKSDKAASKDKSDKVKSTKKDGASDDTDASASTKADDATPTDTKATDTAKPDGSGTPPTGTATPAPTATAATDALATLLNGNVPVAPANAAAPTTPVGAVALDPKTAVNTGVAASGDDKTPAAGTKTLDAGLLSKDPTAPDGAATKTTADASLLTNTNANSSDTTSTLLQGLDAAPAAANTTAAASGSTDTKVVTGLNDAGAKAALDALAATTQRTSTDALQNTTAMKAAVAAPNAEPYKQVVHIVAPLKQLGDGDYQMTLRLHPEHLGRVDIAVSLAGGQVNMQMNADNPQSRQLLRDSMNDLRSSLAGAGLSAGSLDVGTGDTNAQRDASNYQGANRSFSTASADESNEAFFNRLATVAPAVETASTDGPLDVHV